MTTLVSRVDAPGHVYSGHPEHPDRLSQVRLPDGIETLDPTPASLDEIARVHDPELIAALPDACRQGPGIIDHAPTFVTPTSFDDALLAAGATLGVTRAVLDGNATNGFALVRPPGHHAEPGRPMGFCLFNNIAVAAADAFARGLERVLGVDYDAHHGNGTQAAAWGDERFAYFSTHQEFIYPGTGALKEAGHARGRIANLPLPAGTGDAGFAGIGERALAPFVRAFRPQLMLVSAGFDAHWDDPLTSLGLSTAGYSAVSRLLVELAGELCAGRIVFVLEGGYDPRRLADGVSAVLAALTGAPLSASEDPNPYREPDISARLDAFRDWHALTN